MATTLSNIDIACTLLAKLSDEREETNVLTEVAAGLEITPATALSNGTTANKADRLIVGRDNSILSGNTSDIDLNAFTVNIGHSSGLDLLNNPVDLAEVVAILIRNQAGSVGNLHIGGEGSVAAWSVIFDDVDTAKIVIKPGGLFFIFCPVDPAYPVVGGGTDYILRLAAAGGDVTYDAVVLGRSD